MFTKTRLLTTIKVINFSTITATEIPLIFVCTSNFSTDKPLKYSGFSPRVTSYQLPVTSYQLPVTNYLFPAYFILSIFNNV